MNPNVPPSHPDQEGVSHYDVPASVSPSNIHANDGNTNENYPYQIYGYPSYGFALQYPHLHGLLWNTGPVNLAPQTIDAVPLTRSTSATGISPCPSQQGATGQNYGPYSDPGIQELRDEDETCSSRVSENEGFIHSHSHLDEPRSNSVQALADSSTANDRIENTNLTPGNSLPETDQEIV